jgi:hypothetical protein
MSQTTIPFPWYVLINDDEELLVVLSEETGMVAIFTSEEYAELYNQRCGSDYHVIEISELDSAIKFLAHISGEDPMGEDDHVQFICLDPIDPEGDEDGSAFEIEILLSELRKLID